MDYNGRLIGTFIFKKVSNYLCGQKGKRRLLEHEQKAC